MKRFFAVWLTAGLVVSGCGLIGGSGGGPCGAAASPAGVSSTLKVGIVTDIGHLEDKSFNEYSCRGCWMGPEQSGHRIPR
jgi:basic membrane lipoprotein Med (substrate-binding protein (PBP1-ABC) superfamily)